MQMTNMERRDDMQKTWPEDEHKLTYKSVVAIPKVDLPCDDGGREQQRTSDWRYLSNGRREICHDEERY